MVFRIFAFDGILQVDGGPSGCGNIGGTVDADVFLGKKLDCLGRIPLSRSHTLTNGIGIAQGQPGVGLGKTRNNRCWREILHGFLLCAGKCLCQHQDHHQLFHHCYYA